MPAFSPNRSQGLLPHPFGMLYSVQYTVYEEMLKEMRERGGQPLEGGRPAGRGEGGGINPCL